MTTDAADFLAIDALLSDEERLLRDTVRQFVQDRVLPDVAGKLTRRLDVSLGFSRVIARDIGNSIDQPLPVPMAMTAVPPTSTPSESHSDQLGSPCASSLAKTSRWVTSV